MAAAKGARDNGTMVLIVVALLLTLVGAGTGFAVGSLLDQEPVSDLTEPVAKLEQPAEPAASEDHGAQTSGSETAADISGHEEEAIDLHAVKVISFPPVLTTLAEPKGKWIRLEGSVQLIEETEDPPELLAERSGEQILTYLRSLRLDQLEGPSGVLGLREDLNEMVQTLSKGQVRGVLIHGLVVE